MNAMLDIVGAAIIGGLLLLTMINALFNVQSMAFDIHQQILLTETSEILARVVGDYISLAGAGVAGVILDSTGVSRFRFQTNDSTFTSTLRTYEIVQQDSMNMGFPLEAYIRGFFRVLHFCANHFCNQAFWFFNSEFKIYSGC